MHRVWTQQTYTWILNEMTEVPRLGEPGRGVSLRAIPTPAPNVCRKCIGTLFIYRDMFISLSLYIYIYDRLVCVLLALFRGFVVAPSEASIFRNMICA